MCAAIKTEGRKEKSEITEDDYKIIEADMQELTDKYCKELDVLAGRLEDRETSLEDSFRLYKQGMELLKYCNDKLDTVEKKMLQMNEDGSLGEFSR